LADAKRSQQRKSRKDASKKKRQFPSLKGFLPAKLQKSATDKWRTLKREDAKNTHNIIRKLLCSVK